MPTRKRKSKKKLDPGSRKHDAKKWFTSKEGPNSDYIAKYMKRYGVNSITARDELFEIGFYDEVCIEDIKAEGLGDEYIVNP